MSWWDAKGLTSLATQALKTAQKKIDKVLDIKEEDEQERNDNSYSDARQFLSSSTSSSSLLSPVIPSPSVSALTSSLPQYSAGTSRPNEAAADGFFSSWLSSPSAASNGQTTKLISTTDDAPSTKPSHDEGCSQDKASLASNSSSELRSASDLDESLANLLTSQMVKSDLLLEGTTLCQDYGNTPDNGRRRSYNSRPDGGRYRPDICKNQLESDRSKCHQSTQSHTITTCADAASPVSCDNLQGLMSSKIRTADTDCNTDCTQNAPVTVDCSSDLGGYPSTDIDVGWCPGNENNQLECADNSVSDGWNELGESLLVSSLIVQCNFDAQSSVSLSVDVSMTDASQTTVTDAANTHQLEDTMSSLEGSVKESVSSLEGSVKETASSLEGSLEASADELTLVADNDTEADEVLQRDEVDVDSGSLNCGVGLDDSMALTADKTSPRSEASSGSVDVKNLLEEAMVENGSNRDSAGSGSDPLARNESGANSGHTSADEIDTTTSSDIEIISHTSATGSIATSHSGTVRPSFDVSPSRQFAVWNTRCSHLSGGLHRRSDSGSSAQSLQSRTDEDFASPEGHRQLTVETEGHHSNATDLQHYSNRQSREPRRHSAKNESEFNVLTYDVEKLLKVDNRELAKKLAEMAEILEAREKKQLELSHENMDLIELNNDLRNQLLHLEQNSETELVEQQTVKDEFIRRIADMEKRLQAAFRERDSLKASLHDAEMEIARRSENIVSEKLLKEKEQIIAELMDEGEKLSKKQLQNSNTIKKLRAKEKENELIISSQKQKIDEQKVELERLEHILDTKVEAKKKKVPTATLR